MLKKKQATSIQEDGKDADIEEDEGPELLPLHDIDGIRHIGKVSFVLVGKNIDMNESDVIDDDNQEITISRDIGTLSFGRDQFEFMEGEQEEEHHFQVIDFTECAHLLQMNNCMISETGALLLGQTSDMLLLGLGLYKYLISCPSSSSDGGFGKEDYEFTRIAETITAPVGADMFDEPLPDAQPPGDALSDDEAPPDIELGGGGGDFNVDLQEDVEDIVAHEQQQNAKKSAREKGRQKKNVLDDELDPWESYDPHDASEVVVKPFKKGNCLNHLIFILGLTTDGLTI